MGLTPGAFNHALARGQEEPFTAGDEVLIDVIGYDPAVAVELAVLALLAVPLITLAPARHPPGDPDLIRKIH